VARFVHGLHGLRNTPRDTAKTLLETLERKGKRSYNPAHRDWQRWQKCRAATLSRVAS
jgi:hypothetical protein